MNLMIKSNKLRLINPNYYFRWISVQCFCFLREFQFNVFFFFFERISVQCSYADTTLFWYKALYRTAGNGTAVCSHTCCLRSLSFSLSLPLSLSKTRVREINHIHIFIILFGEKIPQFEFIWISGFSYTPHYNFSLIMMGTVQISNMFQFFRMIRWKTIISGRKKEIWGIRN